MMINLAGFQTCDVRGVYGSRADAPISPLHAYLLGRSLAQVVPADQSVLIAGDGRDSTKVLLAALQTGLARACLNLGTEVPTPLAYFAKQQRKAHALAIVTASHHPAPFNGIKIQVGDLPAQPELITCLRAHVKKEFQKGARPPDPLPLPLPDVSICRQLWNQYRDSLAELCPELPNMSIVVDCMHGCYSDYAREALEAANFHVHTLRDETKGNFNSIRPDPSEDKNLSDLQSAVTQKKARLGVGLDGDGDRARFVDENGHLVDNGTMLVLFASYLLETNESMDRTTVVYDQKTRRAVVHALRAAGSTPVREKSGHTFLRSRMLTENALLGGENSGHFFWGGRNIGPVDAGDCGLLAIFVVARMLAHYQCSLSQLASRVPASPFYTGDIRGLYFPHDRTELLDNLATKASRRGYQVDSTDGVRIESPRAFVQLRASVTEPDLLTAVLDADDGHSLTSISAVLLDLLPDKAAEIARHIQQRIEALCT